MPQNCTFDPAATAAATSAATSVVLGTLLQWMLRPLTLLRPLMPLRLLTPLLQQCRCRGYGHRYRCTPTTMRLLLAGQLAACLLVTRSREPLHPP